MKIDNDNNNVNVEEQIFEIKKWNDVALWAWGILIYIMIYFL